MADIQYVRFPPGTVVYMRWSQGSIVYMYIEGLLGFAHGKMTLYGRGAIVQVKPVMVGAKPGGELMSVVRPGESIEGEQIFGGDYYVQLPGSRALLIRPASNGSFQFFLGQKGGIAIQIQPVDFASLKITMPAPPKKTVRPRVHVKSQ